MAGGCYIKNRVKYKVVGISAKVPYRSGYPDIIQIRREVIMTILRKAILATTVAGTALSIVAALSFTAAAAVERISYKDDVFPILQIRCLGCHQPGGEGYKKSGLDLRTYKSLMKGTKFGAIVIPGSALTSNLNVLVEGRANMSIRMPHNKKKLTKCEIAILRQWVNQGAKKN